MFNFLRKTKRKTVSDAEREELRAIHELVQDPRFETLRQRIDRQTIFNLESAILTRDIQNQGDLVADAKEKGTILGLKRVFEQAHRWAKEFAELAKID